MWGRRVVIRGSAVLAAAALAAGGAQLPASATSRSSWHADAVAALSPGTINVAVSPRGSAAYEMVVRSATRRGPFQLRRLGLAGQPGAKGPHFPVSDIRVTAGYVWVSGAVLLSGSSFRLVLYQVDPATLRVLRSWRLTGKRSTGLQVVPVAQGPAGTVWAGFEQKLWRLNTRTGAVVRRVRLPSGLSVSDVAVDRARRHLYVSATPRLGGAVLREYSAGSGRLLATASGAPLKFSASGAALTAVPGGVWVSYRTGMGGQTVLLRQRGLRVAALTGGRGLFNWFMLGSTRYGGGAVWLGVNSGAIGCIAPTTGRVRARARLGSMVGEGSLLGVSAARREVYALGQSTILAITAPSRCWR
jgi:outer membrane protein assembly factor BamB